MSDLTVAELVDELIAWARNLPFPKREEWPLWRWQRWMRERPSDAWEVLERLVDLTPADPEVMDHAARQAELIISYDFSRFSPLVAGLLTRSPLLDAMVGPELFVPGWYGPRYRDLDELASVWVTNNLTAAQGHELKRRMQEDHQQAIAIALEVIARGPLHGFTTEDVDSPLFDCLHYHGPLVISAIEEAAAHSIGVRRAIWDVRRLNPEHDGERLIPTALWERFQAAASNTTTYNTALPPGTRTSLAPPLDEILDAWFAYEETFWAWTEVGDLVRNDPERGWQAILAIVRHASEAQSRCDCGCGPLEDLIRGDPALFIERIEALAQTNSAFQDALACVWLKLEDVPEALARRYHLASGRRLEILDAGPEWYGT